MIYDTSAWYVVLAVVVWWVIGAVWYSPVLFAKQWAAELKRTSTSMSGMGMAMINGLLVLALATLVMTYFIHVTDVNTWMRGAYLGGKLWLFWAALTWMNVNYQNSSRKLFAIDAGYYLVGALVTGAILVH